MSRSFFLYVHRSLCNTPDRWKLGKTMTPYAAVRMRNRVTSVWGGLEHLYFGAPEHIDFLEDCVKDQFKELSGTALRGTHAQTELFDINIDMLINEIDNVIIRRGLVVFKQKLAKPYTASNSGSCPYGIPSENKSYDWLISRLNTIHGSIPPAPPKLNRYSSIMAFQNLFNEL